MKDEPESHSRFKLPLLFSHSFPSHKSQFILSIQMASYGGTTQKCKSCDKKVYFVDQLTADNVVYHKFCFRCHHCKGTLKLGNYSSFEGILYCRHHFDQLYKRTGSLDKSFEGAIKTVRERSTNQGNTNNKLSRFFGGTQDKCVTCQKTVYPLEKVAIDGTSYHKVCFRCGYGGCVISPSNFVAHEQRLYCKHHHSQLFMEKGNFSRLVKPEPVNEGNKVKQEQVQEVVEEIHANGI